MSLQLTKSALVPAEAGCKNWQWIVPKLAFIANKNMATKVHFKLRQLAFCRMWLLNAEIRGK